MFLEFFLDFWAWCSSAESGELTLCVNVQHGIHFAHIDGEHRLVTLLWIDMTDH